MASPGEQTHRGEAATQAVVVGFLGRVTDDDGGRNLRHRCRFPTSHPLASAKADARRGLPHQLWDARSIQPVDEEGRS